MKKTFRMVGMALIALLMAVGLAACSDDKEDEPDIDSELLDMELVGTWSTGKVEESWGWYEDTFTFKKNGSCELTEQFYDEDEGRGKATHKYVWMADGSRVTLTCTYCPSDDPYDSCVGDTETFSYSIRNNGKELRLNGETFYRK